MYTKSVVRTTHKAVALLIIHQKSPLSKGGLLYSEINTPGSKQQQPVCWKKQPEVFRTTTSTAWLQVTKSVAEQLT